MIEGHLSLTVFSSLLLELQGLPSLRVEEIFRRTKDASSVEEGYYDW